MKGTARIQEDIHDLIKAKNYLNLETKFRKEKNNLNL